MNLVDQTDGFANIPSMVNHTDSELIEGRIPKLILIFMAVDWNLYMRRPAVYALAQAARKYDSTVVAVNRPLCPFTTLLRKPDRLSALFGRPQLEPLADNLYIYSPRYFLHDHIADRLPGLPALNLSALRRSFEHLQRRLGIREPRPIVWFNYPQQGYIVDLYRDCFSIYELYDELCTIEGAPRQKMMQREKSLRGDVDLLLTTSHALADKYGRHYSNSIMYGNGLARDTFNRLHSKTDTVPDVIANIPEPRIGYVGMLSERIDWPLIEGLARAMPQWHFVFVGPVSDDTIVERYRSKSNVHIPGPIHQDDVPDVLGALDVGIMPYRDTPFFHYLNALKFYEMAAAGLPMVSSPVEEMRRFPDTVVSVVGNDVESWKLAIGKGLSADRSKVMQQGREIAAEFIWEDMAMGLLASIAQLLA